MAQAVMFCPLLLLLPMNAHSIDFYIGAYTSKDGSKGIYSARLDTETGAISEPKLSVETVNPSYLALHPSGRYIYAVNEIEKGEVSAYAIGEDGALSLLNTQPSLGASPCHLITDRSGKSLFVANYSSGNLVSLPIRPDGSLSPAVTNFQNSGKGPNASRQEGPHMHCVVADDKNRYVYACDLGTDEVLVFRYDAATGKLTSSDPRSAKAPGGAGPRHAVFDPSGKVLFVNNEITSGVNVFEVDAATGGLALRQTIGTRPDGSASQGNTTAEVACHPSGKWLYVSNRGDDTIAEYRIEAHGRLERIGIEPAGVREPRGFAIDPTGKWLVIAGQKSGDLRSMAISPIDGKLRDSGFRVGLSQPVCILFAKP